jgi:3-phenylpropionate/trans-cinnamate dioxygenase ferredoxin component
MMQLRDIAIRSSDPLRLANILEQVFGMSKLRFDEKRNMAVMTDGYLYLAIQQAPASNRSHSPVAGAIDHLGFYVDDLEMACAAATSLDCHEARRSTPRVRFHTTIDGWDFEIRNPGWGWTDIIQAGTTLHELVPVETPTSVASHIEVDAPGPTDASSGGTDFVRVAHAIDIPVGSAARVEIGGTAILVANVNGNYLAIQDACTHMPAYARLSEGQRSGCAVECPVHGSRFDMQTGAVLSAPARRKAATYDVEIRDGSVWVSVAART